MEPLPADQRDQPPQRAGRTPRPGLAGDAHPGAAGHRRRQRDRRALRPHRPRGGAAGRLRPQLRAAGHRSPAGPLAARPRLAADRRRRGAFDGHPAGRCRVRPGGIGKGLAADLLVHELLARGAAGACANLGGDLRVDGDAPGGGPWVVDVGHPLRREPATTIGLRRGAVATSSRVRRAWGPRGDRHHLIDPATGRPARTGLAAATVVAAEGWQAEVMAKAAFLAGMPEGLRLLDTTGTDGLLVDDQGSLHPSGGFDRFTRRARERAG